MSGRINKIIFFTVVLLAAVWTYSVSETVLFGEARALWAAEDRKDSKQTGAGNDESVSDMMENLKALIVDFAGYNACDRIKGQYIPLSSGGSSSEDGKKTNTGIIRIDTCSTREVDPRHLGIEISGIGWQWISREKEKLGATFTVNDYAKFSVKISMTGTFDAAYDKEEHILTLWFVPTQPVEANLKVTSAVDVDTESLWSSVVGFAGSLVGKTPEQRAATTIGKKGDRRFSSRLSQGMTLILDLCTGRHYFKLGSFPAGEIPESASAGRKFLVNTKGLLHEGGLLTAGPFDSDKPVVARISAVQGAVRASLVCENDAEKVTDAYVNGKNLPKLKPLAEETVRPGKPATMRVKADRGCRLVMIIRHLEGQKGVSTFDYLAYHERGESKPFVDCSQ